MSKFHFGNKQLLIKQISDLNYEGNLFSSRNIEDNILENYSKGVSSYLNENNNIIQSNNNTVDLQKHYSPSFRKPVLLPKLPDTFKKANNSQRKIYNKIMSTNNSFSNLESQGLFQLPPSLGKILKKDKTEISVFENNEKNHNSDNNTVQQVNNITNINIHIYSNDLNQTEEREKEKIIFKSKFYNTNKNFSTSKIKDNKENIQINTSLIGSYKILNEINNSDTSNKKDAIFTYNNKKYMKNKENSNLISRNIKLISSNIYESIKLDKNNNNIIKNEFNLSNKDKDKTVHNLNTLKKYLSNSLPDINPNKESIILKENKKLPSIAKKIINNSLKKDISKININNYNSINSNNNSIEFNDIDTAMNFLCDINTDSVKFILFLKLIQIHMDIALLIDYSDGNNGVFRRKMSSLISNEVISKLNTLLNNYFNILMILYHNNNSLLNKNNSSFDCFFLFQSLNNIFHKIIKIQICLFSSMLVTLTQLRKYDLSNMVKNTFNKIIKEITNLLVCFFEYFIKDDINLNYPDLIKKNFKKDFMEHFNKLNKHKKKVNYKNSEILMDISKNIERTFQLIKDYTNVFLKYSLIRPFGDAVFQMLSALDKKSLSHFVWTFLNSILFGELEFNKKKVIKNGINFKSTYSDIIVNINNNSIINCTNYMGSSFFNNIRETPPFLPQINPKYKYTLVLDMDETLVHYFFTHVNGMFLVRPYCFEFLNELNKYYEIVTFTAGKKEYADSILNQLDLNDNIIKYRLYRQHITVVGFSVYKDLTKLGRDLSKIIIVDNFKENFKMQPNNGIFIKTWTSDVNDTQFIDLLKILKDIVICNVSDVRPVIQKMNEEIKTSGSLINPYSCINIPKIVQEIDNLERK